MSVRSVLVAVVVVAAGLGVLMWLGGRGGREQPQLGPVDGRDLPPTDVERVSVGDTAPDFSLRALAGQVVSLSDFRAEKQVVLVFYRGHW